MVPSRVIIAGGTGLVGTQIVELLKETSSVQEIKLLTRRPLGKKNEKISEILVDFDDLASATDKFNAGAAFCCLGTTMKKAGSRESFYRVDHDYVINFARMVHRAGVSRFFLISSMGASTKSGFYYNQVKGQTEADLAEIGFDEVHILRPSILLGDRQESRPGESIGKTVMSAISFLLVGPLRKYRPIRDITVARAMIKLSENPSTGTFIHDSEEIQKLGTP